jgi:putative membrane protein
MMTEQPYARFEREELIVRDYLAADRTALANERTFLAYVRTALGIAAAGGSLIHFLDSLAWDVLGVLLLVMAVFTLAWGVYQFRHYNHRLKHVLLK